MLIDYPSFLCKEAFARIDEVMLPEAAGISWSIKREDLLHPEISGNKWRKLKYNIAKAGTLGHHSLLSFGGAHSNHLYALAAMGKLMGFSTIGVVRGERPARPSATLVALEAAGMRLHFVSRSDYRLKSEPAFVESLHQCYGQFYMIPEGGVNAEGVKGCTEILQEVLPHDYDVVTVAAGTGTTAAGLLASLPAGKELWVFSALKGGEFLEQEIRYAAASVASPGGVKATLKLFCDYHFGGFGKSRPMLDEFITHFVHNTGIPAEHVYTGKMFYGIMDLLRRGKIAAGTRLLTLHTGGMR